MPDGTYGYGYSGYATIGATTVLLMPGGQLVRPRNIALPYPVSNLYGQRNYAEGPKFPTLTLPIACLTSYFTGANVNSWFHNRTGTAPTDLSAYTIVFADSTYGASSAGVKTVTLCKGAAFTLSGRWGQSPLVLNTTWNGIGVSDTTGTAKPTYSPMVTFADVSFGGGLASIGITGFTLNYNNALTPSEVLNGTLIPTEHQPDVPTASLSIEMYASAATPPGTDGSTVTGTSITVSGTTFTFARLLLTDVDTRQLSAGRTRRTFTYNILGDEAGTAWPVAFS